MIHIVCPSNNKELQSIVTAAFERSCGVGSIRNVDYSDLINSSATFWQSDSNHFILVLVSPPEGFIPFLILILKSVKVKVILFGLVPASLAQYLNMRVDPISAEAKVSSECQPAQIHQFSESAGHIEYVKGFGVDNLTLYSRALRRYDYVNEWNNLGFGAVTADGSIWSLSQCANVTRQNVLAYLMIHEKELSAYCALWDYSQASLLWFNREVGPVDSHEWRLIEIYISQYRFDKLPIWPVLLEIPYGYDGAATVRLDCDEDVESARALFKAYKEWGISLSLALHAKVLLDSKHHQLPREVIACGGAILSHTLTHAPNWGGSRFEAFREGAASAAIINQLIDMKPRYAVSPFHQTPLYARLGLKEAGYCGCIGGLIANDPDFLMARGGRPPGSDKGFIGHSQQCMLHGDCMLEEGDPLKIYKQSFVQSLKTKAIFGYLDHPFSERYQYGWKNEYERIQAHQKLLTHIKNYSNNILYINENDALDWLLFKSQVSVVEGEKGINVASQVSCVKNLSLAVEYGKHVYKLSNQELIL